MRSGPLLNPGGNDTPPEIIQGSQDYAGVCLDAWCGRDWHLGFSTLPVRGWTMGIGRVVVL